jgi:hypothetical protein
MRRVSSGVLVCAFLLVGLVIGTAPALGARMFAPVLGSPFSTGQQPSSVTFSPDGKLLATADAGANKVSVFSVASGGALSEVSGSPFSTGQQPSSVAFSSSGLLASADAEDNTVSVFFHDTTPPVTAGTGDLTAEATSASGAAVSYEVHATDPDSPATVVCDHPSGSTFPLETTLVQCTASDPSGNSASTSFRVTVRDTTAPAITSPGTVTWEATSQQGAVVSYTVTATDSVDRSPSVACTPSSGSTFPLGTTRVSCTATDSAHNARSGSFDVIVAHTAGPAITLPATITAEATGKAGANVRYTASAYDAVDGPATPYCTPSSGSKFKLGTTRVSCIATDRAGNENTAAFEIVVRDTTPPKLRLPAMTVGARGPQDAIIFYSAVAGDLVDGLITPICRPPSGSSFPLGTTRVRCTATDKSRNMSRGSFTVTVKATAPWLTNVNQTHERWISGNSLPHYAKAGPPVGTTFTYALDQPAQVTFAFAGTTTGRLVAGTCVPVTNRNSGARPCQRSITATLRHRSHAGKNALHFEGRITRARWLPPGTYTVKITATANGHRSYIRILQFTIVR